MRLKRTPPKVILMDETVRVRPRGCTTITSKHQVTIPAEAFAAAGLAKRESLRGSALGPGRVMFERISDQLGDTAGFFDKIYPADTVEVLRDEWQ